MNLSWFHALPSTPSRGHHYTMSMFISQQGKVNRVVVFLFSCDFYLQVHYEVKELYGTRRYLSRQTAGSVVVREHVIYT